jgi:hypothetical protein
MTTKPQFRSSEIYSAISFTDPQFADIVPHFAEVGFTIDKLLPEREKGFSPIFNFGIEAKSTVSSRATAGGSAVPANVDARSEPGSVSGSLSASKDLHMRLGKRILHLPVDSDTEPEPRFAGQAKAKPYRRG